MSHMVIFRDVAGRPGYHQAEALDEAVHFVEELRNERQVTDARVFSMHEIPLEFTSYWKVAATVPAGPPPPPPAPPVEHEPVEPFVSALAVAEPIDSGVETDAETERQPLSFVPGGNAAPTHGGRFGLFGRS